MCILRMGGCRCGRMGHGRCGASPNHRIQCDNGSVVRVVTALTHVTLLAQAHEHQRERRLAAKKKAEEEKQAKEEAEAKAKADAKLVATFQAFLDDATGLPYWYNLRTGKTSWDDPTGGVVVPPEPTYALTAADTPWRRTWSEDYGCFYCK